MRKALLVLLAFALYAPAAQALTITSAHRRAELSFSLDGIGNQTNGQLSQESFGLEPFHADLMVVLEAIPFDGQQLTASAVLDSVITSDAITASGSIDLDATPSTDINPGFGTIRLNVDFTAEAGETQARIFGTHDPSPIDPFYWLFEDGNLVLDMAGVAGSFDQIISLTPGSSYELIIWQGVDGFGPVDPQGGSFTFSLVVPEPGATVLLAAVAGLCALVRGSRRSIR